MRTTPHRRSTASAASAQHAAPSEQSNSLSIWACVADLRREPDVEGPWAARYGLSLAFTLAGLLLTLCLWPVTQASPYVVPSVVVGLATWRYGIGPGTACVLLTLLWTAPWLGPLRLPLSLSSTGLVAQTITLAVFTASIGRLAERLAADRKHEQWEMAERERMNQDVANLLANEHNARSAAERARQRFAFLSEASSLLTGTLDREAILHRLVRLTVPQIADWCEIDLLNDEAITAMRPGWKSTDDKGIDVECNARTDPRLREAVTEVIRRGTPIHVEQAPVLPGRTFERDLTSFITAPLMARGRTLGAVTLALSTPDKRYDEEDIALVRELTRRAALSIDNARLYREAQEAKAQIEDLNERLQRAMTETHHRVKNNLQVIAAMVDLLVMDDADSIPMGEVRRMGTHIRTLATVHDILTHQAKEDGDAVDISAKEILDRLLSNIRAAAEHYEIDYRIDDARLPARQATSLALVTNELVSNALKHGRRQVSVRFEIHGEQAVLTVEDDGPGFPSSFNPARAANTGLELVENLSRWDLAGGSTYANRSDGGAHVEITFPIAA